MAEEKTHQDYIDEVLAALPTRVQGVWKLPGGRDRPVYLGEGDELRMTTKTTKMRMA